ncbi:MAG: phytoene/squalene synthase family protein [Proteobacteria bacterium]|nr:phytoene/squalene synthase family protein [Pseudomonadota bacterium]MCP4922296.1 phytoene/squalene synthase family protein [Pseudomonadota bacterium]
MSAPERATLAKGSKSFGFAAWFLADDEWDDAARVYAFCREVDDIADDELAPAQKRRAALDRLTLDVRAEHSDAPAVLALLEVHRRRALDLGAASELIAGCRSDVGQVRIASDDELVRYGYRVASTVGLMMCGVLGVRDPDALPFAIDLGVAMQITNICRDVKEDAENGRIYLPADRLRAAGVEPTELIEGSADRRAVSRVVLDLLDLAERYYASAWEGLRYLPWRARFAILIASRVYRRIGVNLRRADGDALAGRTIVPLQSKLAEVLFCTIRYFHPTVLGVAPAPPHDGTLHAALRGLPGARPLDSHGLQDQDRRRADRHPEEHPHRVGAALWSAPAGAD